MALDKLVDSAQLDSDLTSIANAIRAKSGGSAPLTFPTGFVSAIGDISGGGSENEDAIIVRTISSYTNDRVSSVGNYAFYYYLIVALFIVSPIVELFYYITYPLQKNKKYKEEYCRI